MQSYKVLLLIVIEFYHAEEWYYPLFEEEMINHQNFY